MRFFVPALLAVLMAACGAADAPPSRPPAVKNGARGAEIENRAALDKDGRAHWIQALVVNYADPVPADLPGRVELGVPIRGCDFPAPSASAKVVFVHSAHGQEPYAQVFVSSPKRNQARAEAFAEFVRVNEAEPAPPPISDLGADRFGLAELVLTDRSAPLYIVLGGNENIVWNFQVAPGVQVERVALVSEAAMGVANLDPAIPVDALAKANVASCKARPARLNPNLAAFRASPQDIETNRLAARSFELWFTRNFGRPPETVAIGGQDVAKYLVGPPPAAMAQRPPYRGMKGASVRIWAEDGALTIGSDGDYVGIVHTLVRARAAKIAAKAP